MPVKQIISILALSVIISFPAGIATADSIKVDNGNTRVRINRNGDIRVNRGYKKRIYVPGRGYRTIYVPGKRVYRSRYNPYSRYRYRTYRSSKRNLNCSYQSSTSRSSSGSSRTYNHSSTRICK